MHVNGSRLRVLLVEDSPADARLIQEMLREADAAFDLQCVGNLAAGLDRLGGDPGHDLPHAVLLDLSLPDSHGLETFERLRDRAASRVPIVVLSGLDDETVAIEAMEGGAQDYLVKGHVDARLLSRSLRYAVERKRVEDRIARSEKTLADAQQIAHVGSWEWDVEADKLTWSDELYRIYGLAPREVRPARASYLARVHPADRERVQAILEKVRRDLGRFDFEERIVRPDGSVRIVRSRGEAVVDPAGGLSRLIGASQDITERKTAERELAAALDQALEASRLKSAFLANMSHEIRTPLNVILGSTSIIAEHLPEAERNTLQPLLGGAVRAGQRLMRTIQGILDLSRIESGSFPIEPALVEVGRVIEQRIDEFRSQAFGKGLTVSCEIATAAAVRFDEYCLVQALTHLLDNAVKFTRAGEIAVRLYRHSQSGSLCLEVRDSGIGIDPHYLPRIFEPFSQAESGFTRGFEGSGLGLALARGYVELNGASISAASEKGRGTAFTIHFPPELEAANGSGLATESGAARASGR